MTEKERQSQRRRAEDAAFNRMLLWLLAAVVAELVILLVKHFYVDVTGSALRISIAGVLLAIFRVYRFAGIVLTAVGAAWMVVARKQGKATRLPAILTGVAFLLWVVFTVAYYFFDEGVRLLMILPAIGAVLILVYFLYQRVFFVNTVLTGVGIAALWLYRQYHANHPQAVMACFLLGWILLAVVAVLCWRLRQTGGKLGSVRLMPVRTNYITTWATCLLVAAAMAVGWAVGGSVALYLLFGLLGWLFCQAVFFTVKLM